MMTIPLKFNKGLGATPPSLSRLHCALVPSKGKARPVASFLAAPSLTTHSEHVPWLKLFSSLPATDNIPSRGCYLYCNV